MENAGDNETRESERGKEREVQPLTCLLESLKFSAQFTGVKQVGRPEPGELAGERAFKSKRPGSTEDGGRQMARNCFGTLESVRARALASSLDRQRPASLTALAGRSFGLNQRGLD